MRAPGYRDSSVGYVYIVMLICYTSDIVSLTKQTATFFTEVNVLKILEAYMA